MTAQNDELGRRLPFSLEAEQSVLGSVLIDPESFNDIANIITHEDFYIADHREIYLSMQELFLQNRTIDVVTLIDMLVKRGLYATNDQGRAYIKVIAEIVPSASNVRDYARIVREKSLLRSLIAACGEITETAYASHDEVNAILDNAEQKIFNIVQGNEKKGFRHIRDVIIAVYDHLHMLRDNPEAEKGMPTGFSELDKVLVGMGAGDLVLVGARPGMGKTSFVMNIATMAAKKTKKSVAIFSLEMSCEQLVIRMLSSEALIDSYNMRTGRMRYTHRRHIGHHRHRHEGQTPAGKKPGACCDRLSSAYAGRPPQREQGAGGFGNIPQSQAARQGTACAGYNLRPAVPCPRIEGG